MYVHVVFASSQLKWNTDQFAIHFRSSVLCVEFCCI